MQGTIYTQSAGSAEMSDATSGTQHSMESGEQQGAPQEFTFNFSGTGGELFKISIVNLLLTILTLGIYYFWGKVRVRRFVWSRTEFMGEPFEYTGTGGELFTGFLLVTVLFMLATFAQTALAAFFPIAASVILPLALLVLWPFAVYRAIRYRLTRTSWRGIRGNLDGKATTFLGVAAKHNLLSALTLGLWYPNAKAALVGHVVNRARFGSHPFSFSGEASQIRWAYYKAAAVYVLTMGAYIGMIIFTLHSAEQAQGSVPPFEEFQGSLILYAVVVVAVMGLAQLILYVHIFRWQAAHTAVAGLQFYSEMRAWPLLRLQLGNLLLVLCTLGLGTAWAEVRNIRFLQKHLVASGQPVFASVMQDTAAVPKRGEGFLEAFDVEIGL